jgi:hypothetical protein
VTLPELEKMLHDNWKQVFAVLKVMDGDGGENLVRAVGDACIYADRGEAYAARVRGVTKRHVDAEVQHLRDACRGFSTLNAKIRSVIEMVDESDTRRRTARYGTRAI